MLRTSAEPLSRAYDLALLDLDGVVYIGADAVSGAPAHLAAARAAGMRLAFVTNNASRPPGYVAEHLSALGVDADPSEVVTSAQAAARLLAADLDPGSPVFVIGGLGLIEALEEVGLRGVQAIEDRPRAVVSGYHPDVLWRTVIDGALLVRQGLPWVASNVDATVPTPHGPGPGNGVLVGAVARYAEREPVVAGKPEPTLFVESVRRLGAERPLVVGDRIDTDIEGAVSAGFDSLLVMTGVTGLHELLRIPPKVRPSYVAADLGALVEAQPAPREESDWRVTVEQGELRVAGAGSVDAWWRAVADVGWGHLDATGAPAVAPANLRAGSVT